MPHGVTVKRQALPGSRRQGASWSRFLQAVRSWLPKEVDLGLTESGFILASPSSRPESRSAFSSRTSPFLKRSLYAHPPFWRNRHLVAPRCGAFRREMSPVTPEHTLFHWEHVSSQAARLATGQSPSLANCSWTGRQVRQGMAHPQCPSHSDVCMLSLRRVLALCLLTQLYVTLKKIGILCWFLVKPHRLLYLDLSIPRFQQFRNLSGGGSRALRAVPQNITKWAPRFFLNSFFLPNPLSKACTATNFFIIFFHYPLCIHNLGNN